MIELNKVYNESCVKTLKNMDDKTVDLIIADPPYFEIVKDDWDNQWKNKEEYLKWCEQWLSECYRVLSNTGSIYIYGASPHIFDIYSIVNDIGFKFRNSIVWYFGTGMGGTKKYRIEHENLLFFTNSGTYMFNADDIRVPYEAEKPGGGRTHNPLGKTCGTVWRISRVQRNAKEHTGHPSQKPMEICNRIIKASSNKNDLVYIPFGGSGSEIVSCINNNRKWIASEINKKYIDNIIHPRILETR